jgi:CRP/FNR family cyclic AMP-dependent transcriptional regulator
MESLERVLREHPFLTGLEEDHVRLLTGCAKNTRFSPGELLLHEGADEPTLLLIRQGTVALEAHRPGKAAACVETLGPGDVLGVSWALGGKRDAATAVTLDARARDAVVAFALDGACLRDKMAADDRLGHALSRRLLERVYLRLGRLRFQSLDVYG